MTVIGQVAPEDDEEKKPEAKPAAALPDRGPITLEEAQAGLLNQPTNLEGVRFATDRENAESADAAWQAAERERRAESTSYIGSPAYELPPLKPGDYPRRVPPPRVYDEVDRQMIIDAANHRLDDPKHPAPQGMPGSPSERPRVAAPMAVPEAGTGTRVQPPPKATGGVGGPAGPSTTDNLTRDFNERLAAMEDERQGRIGMSGDMATAYGNAAEEQRGQGLASMAENHAHSEEQRAHLAEIEQLNRDYADDHLDKDKFWDDCNAVQKAGAILGTMFAGLGGGVEGARNYYNDMVDRSLNTQRYNIEQKARAGQNAENLLSSLRKTSTDEQEANDKARAALIGAAMTEVQRAGAAAKGPIEEAQVRELMADLKTTRDMSLAKIAAARAGAGAASPLGLEVPGDDLIQHEGQTYLITDKSWGDTLRNTLSAYDRLGEAIQLGNQALQSRGALDVINPWSASVAQGESAQAAASESVAKLAGSRGVPPNIAHMVQQLLPNYGSRFSFNTPDNIAKAEQVRQQLGSWAQETMAAAGARPVVAEPGPGSGKHANELVYRVKAIGTPSGAGRASPPQETFGAQPR